MSDQWGRFESSAGRDLTSLGFEVDNVDVYEPDITRTAGSGIDVSYPDTPDTTVQAGIEPLTASSSRDESGTDTDIDVVLFVPSDAGIQWTGYGESGVGDRDAAAKVVLPDGFAAVVTDSEPQQDGFDRLECTETNR